jgi:uncharacterized protein with FMN-binding domain
MKKKHVIILIALLVTVGAVLAINIAKSSIEKNLNQLTQQTIADVDLSKVKDGVFTGSYEVFPIAVEAKVTVKEGKISNIELLKHKNGQGAAAEIITDKVIETQTLEVDVVSGATYSSKVILKAIENALASGSK